jgi:hypothetical protein
MSKRGQMFPTFIGAGSHRFRCALQSKFQTLFFFDQFLLKYNNYNIFGIFFNKSKCIDDYGINFFSHFQLN